MLFNSVPFLFLFLPLVLSIFFLLGWLQRLVSRMRPALGAGHGRTLAVLWLALASLVFYGWDDPARLLPIILTSIAFNFIVGWSLVRRPTRAMLTIGICGNLLLLGYFKYAGFLVDTVNAATGLALARPNIVLPIGISFFTFTQIAFLVDAFRAEAREYKPWHYLLFVSFFPHLVAGPIYHHKEIMPQFERDDIYRFEPSNLGIGLTWFALGLAKKVLLADPVAQYATPVFAAAAAGTPLGFTESWIGVLSFTLQLYYDFSGYSDMAVGLALMIGIRFPLNFNSPYKATSVIDFWKRWHMTLSRFLRDYLYIPLGGNRKGPRRRYVNLMVTMLLGGLWHGAAWNFVIWGALHGLGLVVNHAWRSRAVPRGLNIPAPVAWALTFGFVVLAWVPFRADSLGTTLTLWKSLAGLNGFVADESVVAKLAAGPFLIAALLALALIAPNTQQLLSYRPDFAAALAPPAPGRLSMRWALMAGVMFGAAVSFIIGHRPTEFLYFQF
jgi:alginate O-acetyltransferase complex protein AlgI